MNISATARGPPEGWRFISPNDLSFWPITAEIFPTVIRGTAQGFTYNVGRIISAAAPFAVGTLAQTHGFGTALSISSLAFLAAAVTWIWIPETRGRALT